MVSIQFLGATGGVTGSCYLLQCGDSRVLLECGLLQGSPRTEVWNQKDFAFELDKIDAVVLSHAHLDHSGRLPLLVKRGYRGPIYTTKATEDLVAVLLKDAAFIAMRDAESDNVKRARRHLSDMEPLYDIDDVTKTLPLIEGLAYRKKTDIAPGISVRFSDAGHILGSAIVEIFLNDNGFARHLVFTGDLGHRDAPILKDPAVIQDADLVLMESTYGDRLHDNFERSWKQLKMVFEQAANARANVLIPCFAVGRTQELLYMMRQHFDEWDLGRWQIFLDSPMAVAATEVYAKHWKTYDKAAQKIVKDYGSPFKMPNLHVTLTTEQSMSINKISSGAIIIAGSGMCNGGRIRHHIKHNIWRRGTHMVFVGYQAQGTLGRKIQDGATEIEIYGEPIKVSATCHTITGLSAHADQQGLLDWYSHFSNHPRVALIHGEDDARSTLAEVLYERYTIHPMIPKWGQTLDLRSFKFTDRHPAA